MYEQFNHQVGKLLEEIQISNPKFANQGIEGFVIMAHRTKSVDMETLAITDEIAAFVRGT